MNRRSVGEALAQAALALWFGSMAGFAIVAPILFNAGLTRAQAGDMAGRMITRLNALGLWMGALAVVALLLAYGGQWLQGARKWRIACVGVALTLGLCLQFAIIPPLSAPLPKPIDQYSATDPVRVAYNRMHKVSERLAGAGLFAVLGAIVLGAVQNAAPPVRR